MPDVTLSSTLIKLRKHLTTHRLYFYGCILVMAVFFHKPIEIVLSKTVVSLILSKVESSIVNDMIIGIVIMYLLLLFLTRMKHYRVSAQVTAGLMITLFIYLGYRFFDYSPWEFKPSYFFHSIYYADLLIVIVVFNTTL